MLSLARLQRRFRLLESPYRTPQTLVGGPRSDAALMASSGGTAATKSMGKGSTQHQHLVQTEVPTKLLAGWLATWTRYHQIPDPIGVTLRPHTAGSDLLELTLTNSGEEPVANIIFSVIVDRRGRHILSIRDQNTFDESLRQKRLMTLIHLFLVHRYRAWAVHYVSPTDDNRYQAQKMKAHGLFSDVHDEVGHDHRRGRERGGRPGPARSRRRTPDRPDRAEIPGPAGISSGLVTGCEGLDSPPGLGRVSRVAKREIAAGGRVEHVHRPGIHPDPSWLI